MCNKFMKDYNIYSNVDRQEDELINIPCIFTDSRKDI